MQGDRRVSWCDLDRRAGGVAATLLAAGLARQDRVAWMKSYVAPADLERIAGKRRWRDTEMDEERAGGVREPESAPSAPSHLLDRKRVLKDSFDPRVSGEWRSQIRQGQK